MMYLQSLPQQLHLRLKVELEFSIAVRFQMQVTVAYVCGRLVVFGAVFTWPPLSKAMEHSVAARFAVRCISHVS